MMASLSEGGTALGEMLLLDARLKDLASIMDYVVPLTSDQRRKIDTSRYTIDTHYIDSASDRLNVEMT
jgi:hypothetical protein